ncbi:hypothetical protein N474_14720 [Pseudoalteromonas luteoviolacea CPMOR-2]|nr:hypothetical protein N474_14720 [Pseudoalteromonas luteoviolacea CPMOR-2]
MVELFFKVENMPRNPCKHGPDTEKYSSGACKICAREKKKLKDFEKLTPEQQLKKLVLAKNRELREAAKVDEKIMYKPVNYCRRCGGENRYVKSNSCAKCHNHWRAPDTIYVDPVEYHLRTEFKDLSIEQVILLNL